MHKYLERNLPKWQLNPEVNEKKECRKKIEFGECSSATKPRTRQGF